jgi:hypothetical protein
MDTEYQRQLFYVAKVEFNSSTCITTSGIFNYDERGDYNEIFDDLTTWLTGKGYYYGNPTNVLVERFDVLPKPLY